MLVKQLAAGYDGKVVVVDQNYGESPLAERYGVAYYPAVFIEDALVARPEDFFSFDGRTEDGKPLQGKYMPWKNAQSRAKFKADMKRMIDLVFADMALPKEMYLPQKKLSLPVPEIPEFELAGLEGNTLRSADFQDKTTIVMIWATWCPPCKTTMAWFARNPPKDTAMLAIAVASQEAAVRKTKASMKLKFPIAMGDDALLNKFGDITSIPTIFVFAPNGRTARIIYGAPEDLEQQLTRLVNQLNAK